jgi:predicted nucleic acid-binding protein
LRKLSLPTADDDHYLAVAESLDTEFWTADKGMAHAVRTKLGYVHLVGSDD